MDQAKPASELAGPSALAQNTVVASSASSGGNVPPGTVAMFGNSTPPTGWLLCNGAAVSRTTYATLFGVIGTTFGSGDGSTTFNVPDLVGRVPVGYADSGGHTDVSALGNNDGTAKANRRPKHRHTPHSHSYTFGGSGGANTRPVDEANSVDNHAASTTTVDGGSGTSTDPLDAPAYLVLPFIIRT